MYEVQYIIVMIKINSIWARSLFSTIRFPNEHVRNFQLNKQVRSCLSLKELTQYIQTNDQDIRSYGKTVILECLNEFPLAYTYKSLQSQLKVYLYVLQLQDLNIYEQQLRYSNLLKLTEYAAQDSYKIQKEVQWQQKRIEDIIKHTPFDMVDALNWIIMYRRIKFTPLVRHAFEVICNYSFENVQTNFNRLMMILLKRIGELQWYHLRTYKRLFKFICNKYELPKDKTNKMMVSILERLTLLKLHLMGYSLPIVINQIYDRIEQESSNLSMLQLQVAFQCFQKLPHGYNYRKFKFLFNLIMERASKQTLFLHMLPISHMNFHQRQLTIKKFLTKPFPISDTLYIINNPKIKQLLKDTAFADFVYQKFIQPIQTPEYMNINLFNGYISTGAALVHIFSHDAEKLKQINEMITKVHLLAITNFKQYALVQNSSLCTLFHCMFFNLELGLMKYKVSFEKVFLQRINAFHMNRFRFNWKSHKHFTQIFEIISAYKNSKKQAMVSHLNNFILREIRECEIFDYAIYAAFVFELEEAENWMAFAPAVGAFYNRVKQQDNWIAFVETFIAYDQKSAGLTQRVVEQIWKRQCGFWSIVKIIAGVPSHFFADCEGNLTDHMKQILKELSLIQRPNEMSEFSIDELQRVLCFCRKYFNDAKQFAVMIIKLMLDVAESSSSELNMQTEIGSQFSFVAELLNLCVQVRGCDFNSNLSRTKSILQKITEGNHKVKSLKVAQIQLKLLLKRQLAVDEYSLKQQLYKMIQHLMSNAKIDYKSRIMLAIFKLYSMDEILLDEPTISTFKDQIKLELEKYKLDSNQVLTILGTCFIDGSDRINSAKAKPIIEIVRFIIQHMDIQQSREFYFYYLQFAHRFKQIQMAEICLVQLARTPFHPYQIVRITEIESETQYACKGTVNQRLIADIAANLPLLKKKQLFLLRYLDNYYQELPVKSLKLLYKIMADIQNDLQKCIQLVKQKPILFAGTITLQFLSKLIIYFSFAIRNKWASAATLQIFRFSCASGKDIYCTLDKQSSDIRQISLFKFYLFSSYFLNFYQKNTNILLLQPTQQSMLSKPQQETKKKSYFTPKKQKEQTASLNLKSADIQQDLQKYKAILIKLRSPVISKLSSSITNKLMKLGLKEQTLPLGENSNNYYVLNYPHSSISLPIYIKKDNKQHVVVFASTKDAHSLKFLLQAITGLIVIPIDNSTTLILP